MSLEIIGGISTGMALARGLVETSIGVLESGGLVRPGEDNELLELVDPFVLGAVAAGYLARGYSPQETERGIFLGKTIGLVTQLVSGFHAIAIHEPRIKQVHESFQASLQIVTSGAPPSEMFRPMQSLDRHLELQEHRERPQALHYGRPIHPLGLHETIGKHSRSENTAKKPQNKMVSLEYSIFWSAHPSRVRRLTGSTHVFATAIKRHRTTRE
jgi:hypothetical protein